MKSREFLVIAVTLIVLFVIGYRAYDYFVMDDITLQVVAPCNPATEKCFIVQDLDAADFDFQTKPYKKIQIIDRYAPDCLEEHNCEVFSCKGITTCEETLCSEDTLEGNESCVEEPAT